MLGGWLHALSTPQVLATLDRLGIHRLGGYRVREAVCAAIAHLGHPIATDTDLRRLATLAEPELVLRMKSVIGPMPTAMDRHRRANDLHVLHAPLDPLLQGRHLKGLRPSPGPWMGEILREAYEHQLDGRINTIDDALQWASRLQNTDS